MRGLVQVLKGIPSERHVYDCSHNVSQNFERIKRFSEHWSMDGSSQKKKRAFSAQFPPKLWANTFNIQYMSHGRKGEAGKRNPRLSLSDRRLSLNTAQADHTMAFQRQASHQPHHRILTKKRLLERRTSTFRLVPPLPF